MNFWSRAIVDWNLVHSWIGQSTRKARLELQMGEIGAVAGTRQLTSSYQLRVTTADDRRVYADC